MKRRSFFGAIAGLLGAAMLPKIAKAKDFITTPPNMAEDLKRAREASVVYGLDDPHTQYQLLKGRSGGQLIVSGAGTKGQVKVVSGAKFSVIPSRQCDKTAFMKDQNV